MEPVSFAEHLPEVLREDDLLRRFLMPFEVVFAEARGELGGSAAGTGGLPDVFSPDRTPPPEFTYSPSPPMDYLDYLASWIGLPLRQEKPAGWNRRFLTLAVPLLARSGTRDGLVALLRAWLSGDVLDAQTDDPDGTRRPTVLLTDLLPAARRGPSAFQLGVTATLGVETVLGAPPPGLFVVDVVVDQRLPGDVDASGLLPVPLRSPAGLDALARAATSLLDRERPAPTTYQLRLRGESLRLAPAHRSDWLDSEVYGQLPDPADPQPNGTSLLWTGVSVYASGDAPATADTPAASARETP
jgi:phage tail-like protein